MASRRINDVDRHVGTKIRLRRNVLGLTQPQLAAALGVSYQQLQKYEGGLNRVTASRLFVLCAILNVSADYFFTDDAAEPAERPTADPVAAEIMRQPDSRSLNEAFRRIRDRSTRASVIAFIEALARDAGVSE